MISTSINIDKYRYATYDARRTSTQGDRTMNSDANLAAWMIAGGRLTTKPGSGRDQAHRLALLAARRPAAHAGPSRRARIAATIAAFRAPRTSPDLACCPA
jgi:hypothetical protein